MFCTNCGASIEDGNLFCVNCGTRVEAPIDEHPTSDELAAQSEAVEAGFAQEVVDSIEEGAEVPADDATAIAEELNEISQVESAPLSSAVEEAVALEGAEASIEETITLESTNLAPEEVEPVLPVEPVVEPIAEPTQAQVPSTEQMPVVPPMQGQAPAVAAVPLAGQQAPMHPMQSMQQVSMQSMQQVPQQKKSNKGLIIAIIAVVVIIAGILAYVFGIGPALKASKEYDVQIVTAGSAIDATATTPLAVGIKGTVLSDNSEFKETVYVSGTDTVKLHEGSYTATAVAPVLASDGTLIGFSPENISFQVTEQNGEQQLLFTAAPVDSSKLTESLITLAATMALESGESQTVVDGYVASAKEKLAAAQKAAKDAEARKQAEEAAKKKAEEEAKAHTSGATWYVCASDFVTMRVSPSTSARAITRINSRVAVTYLGDAGGGWYRIRYDGREGYVLSRFISYDKNAPLDYGDV